MRLSALVSAAQGTKEGGVCVPGGRGEIEGGRGGWLEDDPMRGVLKAG